MINPLISGSQPQVVVIPIYRGVQNERFLSFFEPVGEEDQPLNVLDYFDDFKMMFRVKEDPESIRVISLSLGDGLTVQDDNVVKMTLTREQCAILDKPNYYSDLLAHESGGEWIPIFAGKHPVQNNITTP